MNISDFCDDISQRCDRWLQDGTRVLITLNTRKSARKIRDRLSEQVAEQSLFFITADVTPLDRIKAVQQIKEGKPCIVVSTQCVEAGVDMDMDIVIRDFAPLDSIIQIAGRCNREGSRSEPGVVEIVDLADDRGRQYSNIYDAVHLQITRQVINDTKQIEEKEILDLTNQYFQLLADRKDTGSEIFEQIVKWKDYPSVRELLRGEETEKFTFLILEQDKTLKEEMRAVNEIQDRWKRREGWRSIAGRIARISVSVYARRGFYPEEIADEFLGHWIVKNKFYSTKSGLQIPDDSVSGAYVL